MASVQPGTKTADRHRASRVELNVVCVLMIGRIPMKNLVARFCKDESGATAIEYGLIASLVGVAIIGALNALTGGLNTTFGVATTALG